MNSDENLTAPLRDANSIFAYNKMFFLNVNGLPFFLNVSGLPFPSLCSRESFANIFYLMPAPLIGGENLRHCVKKDSTACLGLHTESVRDQLVIFTMDLAGACGGTGASYPQSLF